MWTINLRLGIAELALATGLAFLAGLTVLFILEWPVGLVPAVSYGLLLAVAYAGYRVHTAERQKASTQHAAEVPPQRQAISFRVVDTLGACPLGRRLGDVITVTPGHPTTPQVCPAAETVLRLAAADGRDVNRWCCPIYDHMLVLEKVPAATAA